MEDSREIQFSPVFTMLNDNCFLMELPEGVMGELKEGREVVVKGAPEEDAVLCTEKGSYLLRSHETSNSVLVLDESGIILTAHQVLISESFTPPLHKLHHLLSESPFTWSESAPSPLYTLQDLFVLVQASKQEIFTELKALHAFEWRGYWRVMDDQVRIETIKHVLCVMMRGHMGTITVEEVLGKVDGVRRGPLEVCLETAGRIDGDVWVSDPLQLYKMCATDLLLSKPDYFEDEFRTAFQHLSDMLIPSKLSASYRLEDILPGIAIRKTVKGRNVCKYFPVEGLVKEFGGRLEQLFAVKEKWSVEEMRPYVGDVGEKELQQSLMRSARRVVEDGVPLYMRKA